MNADVTLLNEIYQNSHTAIKAMSVILPKTQNTPLFDCLFSQICEYRSIANSARTLLEELNAVPMNESFLDKSVFYFCLGYASFGKNSCKRAAKLLSFGSREGIFDITEFVNCCDGACEKSRKLAYRLIKTEEKNICKMSEFL